MSLKHSKKTIVSKLSKNKKINRTSKARKSNIHRKRGGAESNELYKQSNFIETENGYKFGFGNELEESDATQKEEELAKALNRLRHVGRSIRRSIRRSTRSTRRRK